MAVPAAPHAPSPSVADALGHSRSPSASRSEPPTFVPTPATLKPRQCSKRSPRSKRSGNSPPSRSSRADRATP
eukprot:8676018-Alexandrium_andersonii.AAC.1